MEWQQPQFNPYGSREEQQQGGVYMAGGRMQSEAERYHGTEHPYSGSFGGRTGETFFGKGPRNYKRTDERIKEEICEKLTFNPDVDATEIDLTVEKGEVTLTGMVHNKREKRHAEEIAEDVFGVENVHNNLRIGVFQNQGESNMDQLSAQQRKDQILDRPR
ncbi:MAG: BON domain-containing protein [Candidatus Obscuribacterales bacterium]|nr:BON domain-containing protein [Candidatus Obscuribacterales bacterium]